MTNKKEVFNSVRRELWSDEIKSGFLKLIGEELIETINNRMISLIEDDQHNEEDSSIDDLCSELEEDLPEGDLVI